MSELATNQLDARRRLLFDYSDGAFATADDFKKYVVDIVTLIDVPDDVVRDAFSKYKLRAKQLQRQQQQLQQQPPSQPQSPSKTKSRKKTDEISSSRNMQEGGVPEQQKTNKKRRIDSSNNVVKDLHSRILIAKAAAGPIKIQPTTIQILAATNRDIDLLNLSQLDHETIRLEARIHAVKERKVHLLSTRTKIRKKCSFVGCPNVAQKGGVCRRHGAPRGSRMCSVEGCTRQNQRGGVCFTHGAKYKLCTIEGCPNKIQQGGLCCKHGAKVKKCRFEGGCTKNAQRGGLCHKHQRLEREQQSNEEEKGDSDSDDDSNNEEEGDSDVCYPEA